MIRISNNKYRDIDRLNEEHCLKVKAGIITRLNNSLTSKTISKCQHEFIHARIDIILKGKPDELVSISQHYKSYCNARRCTNITKGLTGVFSYKKFSKKHMTNYCAYNLASALDVRVCPYCNRQYTFTVVTATENISRPEFDHFFSQSDYPLLSMSFYNLIPSCKICNSTLKHTKKFTLEKHIHPYEHGFDNAVKFTYYPKDAASAIGMGNNIEIRMDIDDDHSKAVQLKNNVKVFKLEDIYQGHADIVSEIVRKFYMSDGRYLEMLYKNFPIGTYEDLYRLAFGNYFLNEHLDQRILSKLTKDIVSYLDFVLPVAIDDPDTSLPD